MPPHASGGNTGEVAPDAIAFPSAPDGGKAQAFNESSASVDHIAAPSHCASGVVTRRLLSPFPLRVQARCGPDHDGPTPTCDNHNQPHMKSYIKAIVLAPFGGIILAAKGIEHTAKGIKTAAAKTETAAAHASVVVRQKRAAVAEKLDAKIGSTDGTNALDDRINRAVREQLAPIVAAWREAQAEVPA